MISHPRCERWERFRRPFHAVAIVDIPVANTIARMPDRMKTNAGKNPDLLAGDRGLVQSHAKQH